MTKKSITIDIFKIATVVLPTLSIYWKDLTILVNEATTNELTTHIIVVPFLIAFILYRRRSLLRVVSTEQSNEPIFPHEILGILFCTIALMMYLTGSYTFHALEYHLFSMPLFIAGTILIIFNKNTLKTLILPLTFLMLLIPPPIKLAYTVGNKLAVFSSEIAYFFLKGIGLPISLRYYDETPILLLNTPQDQSIPLAIDIGCSGIYSLVAFTAFVLFILYLVRGGIRQKVTLSFLGYPIMYSMNFFRITLIVLIGYWYGQEAALGFFHIFGGPVLVFLGTLILLIISEKILKIKIFGHEETSESCSYHEGSILKENFCPACGKLIEYQAAKISKRHLLKITALAIFTILIISIKVPFFTMTQGQPEIIKQIPLKGEEINMKFLPTLPDFEAKFLYRDTEYENQTNKEARLIYAYLPEDNSKTLIIMDLQISRSFNFHTWDYCINPNITFDLRDVELAHSAGNPPVIGRFFTFQRKGSNTIEVILYWFEDMIVKTDTGFEKKALMISMIAYTHDSNKYQQIEEQILSMGKSIIKYWQPVKDQSWFAQNINWLIPLFINYDKTIIAVLTLAIIIIIAVQFYQTIINKNHNTKLYNKLISEERQILKAVYQADKKGPPTGRAVALEYSEMVGKPIEMDYLLQKLGEAEKTGLIKREILNIDEKPVQGWKSQFSLPK